MVGVLEWNKIIWWMQLSGANVVRDVLGNLWLRKGWRTGYAEVMKGGGVMAEAEG